MQKQFARKIEEVRRLIDNSRSASFLLAVSGGMDSMCMLDLFCKVLPTECLAVAHCNFSLRGDESDGDEMLVREWAERNGVRLYVKRFQTVEYAQENGISIEMAARDLRYAWFAELCSEHGHDVLAVAHNANDNAETLMLNLLRGTGLNGLHGMAQIQPQSALRGMVVFRPLLEYTRKQIEGYVLAHRVPYRHDSTNFESDYKRNKIRNEVFPVFEKINPSVVRTLNREIGYFAEAGSIVEDWCRAQMQVVVTYDESQNVIVNISRLLALEQWRYLLYYILSPYGFNQQVLSSVESLLTSSRTISGKRFESPTHTLLTGRGVLTIVPTMETSVKDQENGCSLISGDEDFIDSKCRSEEIIVVRGEGTYEFNCVRFALEVLPWDKSMPLKQPEGILIMDADKLSFPFVCRKWRQGDWLIPLGMRGKKKVSDIFTDLKYDAFAKDAAVVIVDTQTAGLAEHQHVSGILCVRIDNRYKVTESTKTILRCSIL